MIRQVYPITLVLMLSLSVVLAGERSKNFRNRRMPIPRSGFAGSNPNGFQPKRNHVPFIIRVPYSKIVPSNALFSHSVSWKTKAAPPPSPTGTSAPGAKSADEPSTASQTLPDVQVSQFHAQDTNGQVVFGFNSPDQMRIEQRNADGTVHGTYSYLDPYGQIIKRQYWDTGAGFHVTSDSYPYGDLVNGNGENSLQNAAPSAAGVQYTPEVQAARDLHFQLYQQALASFLPSAISVRNDVRRNDSAPTENDNSSSNQPDSSITSDAVIVTPSAVISEDVDTSSPPSSSPSSIPTSSTAAPAKPSIHLDGAGDDNAVDANQGSINIVEPDTDNGSIVIQKPEYLRISWTTENKKYRVNPSAGNRQDDNWSEKSTTTTPTTTKTWTAASADIFNVTNFVS